MSAVNINIRTDVETKREAEALFNALGLNMTTAINVFLKKSIQYGGIPFEIRSETPNATTLAAMGEFEEMKKHPEAYRRYSSFKEGLQEVLEDDEA